MGGWTHALPGIVHRRWALISLEKFNRSHHRRRRAPAAQPAHLARQHADAQRRARNSRASALSLVGTHPGKKVMPNSPTTPSAAERRAARPAFRRWQTRPRYTSRNWRCGRLRVRHSGCENGCHRRGRALACHAGDYPVVSGLASGARTRE